MRSLALLLTLLAGHLAFAAEPTPPKGFTLLFNGKDLKGWHGMPHYSPYNLDKLADATPQIKKWTEDAFEHWKVECGELVNDGGGAYLTTDKWFGDIELLIEYKTVAKADSGIYLRATPRIVADKSFGEWNSFRILQIGEHVTVYLNGKLVVDHARLENFWNKNLPLRKTGPIQLQTHGGEIRWRNVFIREIPADEANAILRERESKKFVDLFNGKDFTGWTGAKDGYEIKEGAIANRPGKGGNIFTEAEFADFTARVEYKMPEGGNNGLAIRYPGKGQPSVEAMCEVQILDDNAPKHTKLDPRQYNGSVYGMIPAHRNYDRPIGEWNFMEVTVKGPKIQVELNGTRIVDGDVSKVTEFMDNKKHPGKDQPSGHFGFAGHNDPVMFRNIRIRN
jgi:Domain of Unknown Function (DUF1080)